MQENAEGSELIIGIWEFAVRFWGEPSDSEGVPALVEYIDQTVEKQPSWPVLA